MSERAQALEAALRALRNACHAIKALSYDEVKASAGYTNLKCWTNRMDEADALLAAAAPPVGVSPQLEADFQATADHIVSGIETKAESQIAWEICEALKEAASLSPVEPTPPEREGVWNPNGEGQQPDIPGGIAKDHARAKQPVIAYACLYPKLAAVAREHGYALAMHGSLVADCDLIAVPWILDAKPHAALVRALAEVAGGLLLWDTHGPRPAGVRKHIIHLGGGPYIDLAVFDPSLASVSTVEPTPEPPTNPACKRCGHPLSAHRPEFGVCDGSTRPCACPEFVLPAGAPAPCVWRETEPYGPLGQRISTSCDRDFYTKHAEDFSFCGFCGHPLTVER